MSRDAASVTLVGRAGTNPQPSVGSTGDRVSLRVVATERRFDKAADDWVNGDEFGVTVVCWKTLGASVLTTVRKGDPVIVAGRIATRRFERDGATQYFTEVKADFVGLDVAKCGTRFTRNPIELREPEQRVNPVDADRSPAGFGPAERPEDRPEPPEEGGLEPAAWNAEHGAGRDAVLASGG